MTQEEKQLLIKDLCARLPYRVKINIRNDYTRSMEDVKLSEYHFVALSYEIEYRGLRPYLRPMSSMTEEEKKQYSKTQNKIPIQWDDCGESTVYTYANTIKTYDWLNENHFDYRGLTHRGLALEAPEGMYKTE